MEHVLSYKQADGIQTNLEDEGLEPREQYKRRITLS